MFCWIPNALKAPDRFLFNGKTRNWKRLGLKSVSRRNWWYNLKKKFWRNVTNRKITGWNKSIYWFCKTRKRKQIMETVSGRIHKIFYFTHFWYEWKNYEPLLIKASVYSCYSLLFSIEKNPLFASTFLNIIIKTLSLPRKLNIFQHLAQQEISTPSIGR